MDFDIPSISEIGLSKLLDKEVVRELFGALGNLVRVELTLFDLNKKRYSEIRLSGQNICRNNEEKIGGLCDRIRKNIMDNLPMTGLKRVDCESGFSYLLAPLDYETEVVGFISMGPYICDENKKLALSFLSQIMKSEEEIQSCIDHYRVLSNSDAAKLIKEIKQILSSFLYSSYKMYLTSKMHLESERENYAEIEILNNRLNEMLSEVESVSKYKTAFIKTITHELRTPLTSIIGFSEILEKECSDNPEIKGYASTINQKGTALLQIINDILILSSIESGTLEVKNEKRDIVKDLRDILNSFYERFESKALRVSFLPKFESLIVDYDGEKFSTVIKKIIDNSIKFTPEGGSIAVFLSEKVITPEMSGERFGTNPKRYIEITIEDTGCGIDEDKIHMVFEPFYQAVSDMETREQGGMGLGLKIAMGYMKAMGGDLRIESQVGIGTKVTLLLPFA